MRSNSGYRLKNKARLVFFVVLAFVLLAGGSLYAFGYVNDFLGDAGLMSVLPGDQDGFKGRINVLVLGVDARKGEDMARTDTMMLCSVDTDKNLMSILSIPRDTRVNIPGHGLDKINSATLYGGPELAMATVSDMFNIRINNYVMTNYEGFKDIVDSLGGVTIDIKERMYHYDPQDGGAYTIDLRPGVQQLNGEKALQYVRYRGYALGDISRTEHQQKFLSALVKEALQPATVVNLPSLAISFSKAVETNLSLANIRKLAVAASKMNNASLITQTLPGKFLNMDEGSYWEVDPAVAQSVIAGMFEGHVDNNVVLGQTSIASNSKNEPDKQPVQGGVVPQQAPNSGNTGNKVNVPGNTGGTTGEVKKQTGTTKSNKTGSSTGQTKTTSGTAKTTKSSQPSGSMIVPGVPPKNTTVDVTIEPSN